MGDPGLVHMAAPVACAGMRSGIQVLPQVTETIAAFDAAARTLTYQATAGVPAFVTAAGSSWTVTALTPHRCRVDIAAEWRPAASSAGSPAS